MSTINIGVLVSGEGSNLQAMIDTIEKNELPARISIVISNKKKAVALQRAQHHGITAICIEKKDFSSKAEFDMAIYNEMKNHHVDYIVLAGYLEILGEAFVAKYPNKIINIHPSLIPSFCGDRYYGHHVHKAVLDYGAKITGATVHFVDKGTDTGPIIIQECVKVMQDDDIHSLAARVLHVEHKILTQALKWLIAGKITVSGRKVMIKEI